MTQGNSRTVTSSQTGIHPDLSTVVQRHLTTEFKQPLKPFSREIFIRIAQRVKQHGGPLIFDSGCGVGHSAMQLAGQFPHCLVLGIDKSEKRIKKAGAKSPIKDNVLFVRAELIDIWRMARQADWHLLHHYLLYPNPWPKKRHFKRRWHGHPVFPDLIMLGGTLHLRSNWRLYLEEFAFAVKIAKGVVAPVHRLAVEDEVSLFERKYRKSGQELFEYVVDLAQTDPANKILFLSEIV